MYYLPFGWAANDDAFDEIAFLYLGEPFYVLDAGVADAATVLVDLQVSDTQVFEGTDAATVLVDLQASGTDEYTVAVEYTDAETIYLDIRVRGVEEGIFWDTFENLDAWEIDDNSGFGAPAYITKRHATEGLTSLRYTVDNVYGSPAYYQWIDLDNGDNPAIQYWLSFAFRIEDWERVWRNGDGSPFWLPIDFASEIDFGGTVGATPLIRAVSETTGEIGFFDGTTTTWTAINADQWYRVQIGWQNDGTDIVYEVWFEGALEIVSDPVWLGSNQPQWIPKGLLMWSDNGNVSGTVYLDDVIYSLDVQPRQPSIVESAPGTTDKQWVKMRERGFGGFGNTGVWIELDPDYLDTVTEAYLYTEVYIPQVLLDTLSNNEFTNNFLETDQFQLRIVKRLGVNKWWTDSSHEFGTVVGDRWYRVAWHEVAGVGTYDIYIDDDLYTGGYFVAPTGINYMGAFPPRADEAINDMSWIGVDNLAFSLTGWVRSDNFDMHWDFEGLDPLYDAVANYPTPPRFAEFGDGNYVPSLEEGGIGPGPGLPDPLTTETAEVLLTLSIESLEIFSTTFDAAQVYLQFYVPFFSGQEAYGSAEEATITLDLQPGGGECHSTWIATFLGEGEAYLEFYTSVETLEWSGDEELEWSFGDVVTEGINC